MVYVVGFEFQLTIELLKISEILDGSPSEQGMNIRAPFIDQRYSTQNAGLWKGKYSTTALAVHCCNLREFEIESLNSKLMEQVEPCLNSVTVPMMAIIQKPRKQTGWNQMLLPSGSIFKLLMKFILFVELYKIDEFAGKPLVTSGLKAFFW